MKSVAKIATTNPREAAFLILWAVRAQGSFIADELQKWKVLAVPSSRNAHLAEAIATGSCQRALSLDYLAQSCAKEGKLKLKRGERALLQTAVYQWAYMDRIPDYSLVDETVKIAKKHFHPHFVKFLNGLLRSLLKGKPELPQGNAPSDLSIRHSYPSFLVEELLKDGRKAEIEDLLEWGNTPPQQFARLRDRKALATYNEAMEVFCERPLPMLRLTKREHLRGLSIDPRLYFMSPTPAILLAGLLGESPLPKNARILDLCASPGGKGLLVKDLLPDCELHMNDVSIKKLDRIRQNLEKFNLEAQLHCGLGESFSSDDGFDVVIVDAPCSNSGVLNRRPEARWRISAESLQEQRSLQERLLQNARSLLRPGGKIWYMTCSILKNENRGPLAPFQCQWEKEILPSKEGWDGGFAACLS